MNTLDFEGESPTQIDGPEETEGELTLDHSFSDELEPGATNTITVTSQEDDEPAENIAVYINGQNQGSTNPDGELIVNLPEETPIEVEFVSDRYETESVEYTDFDTDTLTTISDTDEEDTEQETQEEDQDEEEQDTNQTDTEEEQDEENGEIESQGFVLENTPQTNTQNTLTLYQDGETITDTTVYLDGENIGQTDSQGKLTFTLPNQETFTLSTETDNIQDSTHILTDYEETSEEDDETGIFLESDLVNGETNTIEILQDGEPQSGETVYADGEQIGETGLNGKTTYTPPNQENIEITTNNDQIPSETFNIQQEHPEPEINLEEPSDGEEFETFTDETTEIEFEYTVETTENDGTVTLNIDGDEHETSLEQGENTITQNIDLSGGNYDWNIEVDTDEFNIDSDSRNLDINEVEPVEGLMLSEDPEAEEFLTITLYQEDEPVEGEEILINDEPYGETDEFGELTVQIPNTEEITITTQNQIDEKTKTVQGYESEDPVSVNLVSPEQDETIEDYEKEFQWSVESEEADYSVELVLNGEVRFQQTDVESTDHSFQEDVIVGDSVAHSWEVEVVLNEETYTESGGFETTEDIPEPTLNINNPAGGESIDNYAVEVDVGATSELNTTLIKEINQNQIQTLDFYNGLEDESFSNQLYLEDGGHDVEWTLIYNDIEDTSIESTFTETSGFETTRELPIAEAEIFEPPHSQVEDPPPPEEVSFTIRPFEQVEIAALIENKDTGEVYEIGTDVLEGNNELKTFQWSYDFEEDAEYEWWVEVDSTESDESIETDSNTFVWDW